MMNMPMKNAMGIEGMKVLSSFQAMDQVSTKYLGAIVLGDALVQAMRILCATVAHRIATVKGNACLTLSSAGPLVSKLRRS